MFQIDMMSRKPVYEQLVEQIERLVLAGIMKPGDQLPSVRNLSVELSINPNTIQKSYSELERRNIIQSVPGRGCFISNQVEDVMTRHKQMKLGQIRHLAEELKIAGVSIEEVLRIISRVYGEEEKKND